MKLFGSNFCSVIANNLTSIGHANLFSGRAAIVENWFVHSKSEYLAPPEQDVGFISCFLMLFSSCALFLVSQMFKYQQSDGFCFFPHSPHLKVSKDLPSQHPKCHSSPLSMVQRSTVQVSVYLPQICSLSLTWQTLEFHYVHSEGPRSFAVPLLRTSPYRVENAGQVNVCPGNCSITLLNVSKQPFQMASIFTEWECLRL